jgi:hypothetical protein
VPRCDETRRRRTRPAYRNASRERPDGAVRRYLEFAQECITYVAMAPDQQRRLHWLTIAEKWLKLAHQAQVWNDQVGSDQKQDLKQDTE